MSHLRLILFISIFAQPLFAETMTVASVWRGEPLDYAFGDHPFSWVVRTTALPGITRSRSGYAPGGIRYTLDLADSMKMEGDFSRWYFRFPTTRRFTSGESIVYEDIAYSIEKCKERGVLLGLESVEEDSGAETRIGQWVVIELSATNENSGSNAEFPIRLANCPVLQSNISKLFGSDNGKGTTIVGAGDFAVTEFDLTRKQLALKRIYKTTGKVQALSQLILRGIPSEREGLTALRVGTVDILIFEDAVIKALVFQDETLRVSECDGRFVAYRKQLKLACDPSIDFGSLRYDR